MHGLILCGGADLSLDRECSQKLFDLFFAHLGRVSFAMKDDVAFDPEVNPAETLLYVAIGGLNPVGRRRFDWALTRTNLGRRWSEWELLGGVFRLLC